MNYTTLVADKSTQGSIKDWINYARISSEDILAEAQAWIYAEITHTNMLVMDDSVAIAQGDTQIAVPDGYQKMSNFSIPGYINKISQLDAARFVAETGKDQGGLRFEGLPTRFAKVGSYFELNTRADQAYTGSWVYFGTPAALSGSNETNFLTDDYPTLLRHVCTMFAAEARKDWDLRGRMEASAMRGVHKINVNADEQLAGMELDFNWEANS